MTNVTSKYNEYCMKLYDEPEHNNFCPINWVSISDGLEYYISTMLVLNNELRVALACTKEIICERINYYFR